MAKYDWEHKYYYGNLIAVSNAYLAYAIRGKCAQTLSWCLISSVHKLLSKMLVDGDYFQISFLWLKVGTDAKNVKPILIF